MCTSIYLFKLTPSIGPFPPDTSTVKFFFFMLGEVLLQGIMGKALFQNAASCFWLPELLHLCKSKHDKQDPTGALLYTTCQRQMKTLLKYKKIGCTTQ